MSSDAPSAVPSANNIGSTTDSTPNTSQKAAPPNRLGRNRGRGGRNPNNQNCPQVQRSSFKGDTESMN